jgi:hypothetical protein
VSDFVVQEVLIVLVTCKVALLRGNVYLADAVLLSLLIRNRLQLLAEYITRLTCHFLQEFDVKLWLMHLPED